MIVLYVIGRVYGMGLSNKMLFTFSLAQGGEFAFVLFSFSVQNGVVSSNIANPLIAAVAVTMALTPLLMILNEKVFMKRLGKTDEKIEDDIIEEKNPVIIAGFGKYGSIIGRFLRANGVETTVLDTDPDKIDILGKLGLKVFYGDASRVDLMHSAGAEEASLLVVAIDEEDKMLQLLENIKKHFPKLRVLVKAKNRKNAYVVIAHGFEDVYLEPMDSSLNIGVQALKMLGFRSHQAVRAANKFKKYETQSVFELAKMRDDRSKYMQSARELISYLENLLLKDVNFKDTNRDLGWDKQSLMDEFRDSTKNK
jgi:voltage-gated potassium channel Kch